MGNGVQLNAMNVSPSSAKAHYTVAPMDGMDVIVLFISLSIPVLFNDNILGFKDQITDTMDNAISSIEMLPLLSLGKVDIKYAKNKIPHSYKFTSNFLICIPIMSSYQLLYSMWVLLLYFSKYEDRMISLYSYYKSWIDLTGIFIYIILRIYQFSKILLF